MSANDPRGARFGADIQIGGLLGGLLGGLPDQIRQKLDEALAKGLGDLANGTPGGSDARPGVNVGFRVRHAAGDQPGVTVEPFGDLKPDAATGKPVVAEFNEPPVDVFEEADHVLVLVEMPGIGTEDVRLDLTGSTLTVTAERGRKRYRKAVALPFAPAPGKLTQACRNGVLEVRIER